MGRAAEDVSDPQGLPERVYGWGRLDFDDRLLLEHLAARSASRSVCRSRTGSAIRMP